MSSPTRAPAQLDAVANTVTPAYARASALISGIFFGNRNGRADQELCHLKLRNSQHLPSQATKCHRKSSLIFSWKGPVSHSASHLNAVNSQLSPAWQKGSQDPHSRSLVSPSAPSHPPVGGPCSPLLRLLVTHGDVRAVELARWVGAWPGSHGQGTGARDGVSRASQRARPPGDRIEVNLPWTSTGAPQERPRWRVMAVLRALLLVVTTLPHAESDCTFSTQLDQK